MFALAVGSKIKLEVRKQGITGEGIGYFNKLAIFVPGAIQKEVCSLRDCRSEGEICRCQD